LREWLHAQYLTCLFFGNNIFILQNLNKLTKLCILFAHKYNQVAFKIGKLVIKSITQPML